MSAMGGERLRVRSDGRNVRKEAADAEPISVIMSREIGRVDT